MLQEFSANYIRQFTQTGISTTLSVETVTLVDNDLIRGNDAEESVGIFDGTQELVLGVGFVTVNDGEALTTVFFNDGTALTGVEALYDRITFKFFESTERFLLDTDALVAFGKTLADVTRVQFDSFVDHDLSWADFGFVPTGEVVPDPEPEPEPVILTLLEGTDGRDRLIGTAADELIRGGDGDDRLTGNAGADVFVFGADARDGTRDRDVITDFNAAEDSIVLEDGVQIRTWNERNGNLIVTLEGGDRDQIVIQNADVSILANFSVIDDLFIA